MTNLRFFVIYLFLALSLSAEDLPKWILEPSYDGRICEAGSGDSERVAVLTAKSALAKNTRVHVSTVSESYGSAQKSSFSSTSLQSANELIGQSKVTDKITHNGLVYVRLCLEQEATAKK